MLMCGNVALCVIGCASGRVELDGSDPEHMCGTRMTSKVGEVQAMCCKVLSNMCKCINVYFSHKKNAVWDAHVQ